MEEVIKLIREEQHSIEALLDENAEKSTTVEIGLLWDKLAKLREIEASVRRYMNF